MSTKTVCGSYSSAQSFDHGEKKRPPAACQRARQSNLLDLLLALRRDRAANKVISVAVVNVIAKRPQRTACEVDACGVVGYSRMRDATGTTAGDIDAGCAGRDRSVYDARPKRGIQIQALVHYRDVTVTQHGSGIRADNYAVTGRRIRVFNAQFVHEGRDGTARASA